MAPTSSSNIHWLLHDHSRFLLTNTTPMRRSTTTTAPTHPTPPYDPKEEKDVIAANKADPDGWLRLGLGGGPSSIESPQQRWLELQPLGDGSSCDATPASAMELFPTYPSRDWTSPPLSAQPSVFRVVPPPATTAVGLWFALRAAQNQGREPFLPQIRKSYLRIKDGRMTVRLLMKYLVSKLGLQHESEVEITCRGQQLPPFHTLQYVRDSIWSSRNLEALIPDSPSSYVTHETNHFIYFYLDQKAILLFKSG